MLLVRLYLSGRNTKYRYEIRGRNNTSVTARKKTNFKFLILIVCIIALLLSIVVLYYAPTILQRGNPIPYWEASKELSTQTLFVPIENEEGTYISKIGDSKDFITFIEKEWGLTFLEQGGSAYLFTDYRKLCDRSRNVVAILYGMGNP